MKHSNKRIEKNCLNCGDKVRHNIAHEASKIMFLLLPLFALFVGLFYSRKKFLYTQHAIFTLHFHSFLFIILLLVALISNFVSNTKPVILMWSVVVLLVYFYLVAALQKVYGQGLWLSAAKGLCISLLYAITLVITVVLLILLTFIIL